jgi:circadian clock protein KaiC
MAHSNKSGVPLTDQGIDLQNVYIGPEGPLTGSARQAQEAREKADDLARRQELENKQRELQQKRDALEARICALRREFEAEQEEATHLTSQEQDRERDLQQDRLRRAAQRNADGRPGGVPSRRTRKMKYAKVSRPH